MRTTLNIDLHIHRELTEYAADKGLSLSDAASYLLAVGLKRAVEEPRQGQAIERPTWSLGTMGPAGVDLSDWAAVKEFLLQEDLERAMARGHGERTGDGEKKTA